MKITLITLLTFTLPILSSPLRSYFNPSQKFTLRADPTHPSPSIHSLGHLRNINRYTYYDRSYRLFEGLPSISGNSSISDVDPPTTPRPTFVGTILSGDLATGAKLTDVDTLRQFPPHRLPTLRLFPGRFNAPNQPVPASGQGYRVDQHRLDWEGNEYYTVEMEHGDGGNKGWAGNCQMRWGAESGCWADQGWTVTEEGGRNWLGYMGQYEGFWALCRTGMWDPRGSSEYNPNEADILRAVNGRRIENCTEPFRMELNWLPVELDSEME